MSVTAGYDHSCALQSTGNVYCWGSSTYGQLGNNGTVQSEFPVEVEGVGGVGSLSNITYLVSGSSHVCGVNPSGNVYCWGENNTGQLGINSHAGPQTCTAQPCSKTPLEVKGVGGAGNLSGIASLAAGWQHACAVDTSGNVYCWGDNNDGQLGVNSTTEEDAPIQVDGVGASGNLTGISSVTAGLEHTCALSSIGNIFCWGLDSLGQLGNNSTTESTTPVESQVVGLGGGQSFFSTVAITPTLISADNADFFTCAVTTLGNVDCWGYDPDGELGDNLTVQSNTPVEVVGVGGTGSLSNIVSVATGEYHACGLNTSGNVYCWASNVNGQLGNNSTTSSKTPVEVSGVGGTGVLSNIVGIAAGSRYSCALNTSGNIYCWGDNTDGQLGNNTTTGELAPVEVDGVGGVGKLSNMVSVSAGAFFACGVNSSANVYCWGIDGAGQLGNNSTTNSSTPVEVTGVGGVGVLANIVQVNAGEYGACAVDSSGNAYCWGSNTWGEIGNNSTTASSTPVQVKGVGGVGHLSNVVSIAMGWEHACAVDSSGNAYCWGDGSFGDLGDNLTTQSKTPVEVEGVGGVGDLSSLLSITASLDYACAVDASGSAYCWGYDSDGQLGNDSYNNEKTPIQVISVDLMGNLTGI